MQSDLGWVGGGLWRIKVCHPCIIDLNIDHPGRLFPPQLCQPYEESE